MLANINTPATRFTGKDGGSILWHGRNGQWTKRLRLLEGLARVGAGETSAAQENKGTAVQIDEHGGQKYKFWEEL